MISKKEKMSEVEELEKQLAKKKEIKEFIDNYLEFLSNKTGVPKPHWEFTKLFGGHLVFFRIIIDVNEDLWPEMWEKAPDKTKRFLERVMAHEFAHWKQLHEGYEEPSESGAEEFATQQTGLTTEEALKLQEEIAELVSLTVTLIF